MNSSLTTGLLLFLIQVGLIWNSCSNRIIPPTKADYVQRRDYSEDDCTVGTETFVESHLADVCFRYGGYYRKYVCKPNPTREEITLFNFHDSNCTSDYGGINWGNLHKCETGYAATTTFQCISGNIPEGNWTDDSLKVRFGDVYLAF